MRFRMCCAGKGRTGNLENSLLLQTGCHPVLPVARQFFLIRQLIRDRLVRVCSRLMGNEIQIISIQFCLALPNASGDAKNARAYFLCWLHAAPEPQCSTGTSANFHY